MQSLMNFEKKNPFGDTRGILNKGKKEFLTVFNELIGDNFGRSLKQDTLVSLVSTSVTVKVTTAYNNIHMAPYSVWDSEVSEFWYHCSKLV